MSQCNCDGSVLGTVQLLPDAAYHLAGTLSPSEEENQACGQAIATMRAEQLDPCDANYDEVLQNEFSIALRQIQGVVSTEPSTNILQSTVDQAIGTEAPGTALAQQPKKPASMNWTFIVGAVLLLVVGFFLVFR